MSRKVIKTSILFTVLSIVASALNFLYYPVAAHTLSLASFGDVQIGISFIMQAAALFTSLNTLALYFAAQGKDQSNVLSQLERIIIATSAVLAIAVVIFAAPLAALLHLTDPSLLYILAIIFILNIPAATWLGSIQGEGQFVASGVIAVVSAASKILIGLLAISLGWGAQGALIGILVGSFIILPLAYFVQKQKSLSIRKTFRLPALSDFGLFTSQPAVIALFCSLFLLALSSTFDVVASKILLDPDAAGTFAQLSTAAKIPYFATIPLAIIAFERLMKKLNAQQHIVAVFSSLVAGATIVTILFEPYILQLFFGAEVGSYDSATFIWLCIAFASYSLTTLLMYALISKRKLVQTVLVAIAAFALPLIFLLGSDNPGSIASSYMIGQVAALILAIGLQYTGSHE